MAEERSEIATRLFLVGCPRSGTTLLQSLLAAHPALTSFPETHAFAHLVPAPRFFRALGLSRPRGFVPMLRLWRELAPAARRPFWTLLTHRPAARRFVGLLDHLARERGRQGWVEKTPRHLHYLEEIRRACPDARFIHLLRPGEEVVASLVEASRAAPGVWRGDRSVPASVARWKRDVSLSLEYSGVPGHTLVAYRQLIEDPERLLHHLTAALGLPFASAMLTGYRHEAAALTRTDEVWKATNVEEIRRPATNKAERLFDAATRRFIADECRDLDQALARLELERRGAPSSR